MLLSKHHGLGNDFVIALSSRNPGGLEPDPETARALCDRRTGIGADGLIYGLAPTEAQRGDGIDLVMVLLNADGSRAEMSGNGVRCLGQAAVRAGGRSEGSLTILTDAGPRTLTITATDDPAVHDVRAGMGRAGAGVHVPEPLAETLPERFGTVDMGNPHLVLLVDDPDDVDLSTEGAWLEQQFPDGINVEYIAVGADRADRADEVRMRVWERGAGVTQACGTGACASAHLAHAWGLVGEHVRVVMPGGECEVELGEDDAVTLSGAVVWIADVATGDGIDDDRQLIRSEEVPA